MVARWGIETQKYAEAQVFAPLPAVDTELLSARLGLLFVPATAADKPAITQEEAIARAYEMSPGLRQASSVQATLGHLSQPALLEPDDGPVDPRYADMGLVWLLTFEGINVSSSGPPGLPRKTSDELNVVIDADTAEMVLQFTYRSSKEPRGTITAPPPLTLTPIAVETPEPCPDLPGGPCVVPTHTLK